MSRISQKYLTFTIGTLLAAPMLSLAELPPTTRPADDQNESSAQGSARGFPNMRGGAMDAPPTRQEIDDASAWARENFPTRARMLENLPPNGPLRARMTQRLVMRYNNMMRTKEQDPALYDILMKQEHLRDDVFAQLRRSGSDLPADEKTALRGKLSEIVDLSLKERQARIEKLERMLAEQKQKLAEDEGDREKLITQQLERMRKEVEIFRRPPRGDAEPK